jgi:hypothetical protein
MGQANRPRSSFRCRPNEAGDRPTVQVVASSELATEHGKNLGPVARKPAWTLVLVRAAGRYRPTEWMLCAPPRGVLVGAMIAAWRLRPPILESSCAQLWELTGVCGGRQAG